MATKAEERKALEKIRNIVNSIGGEDSYIGMAFEGVFEMAEDNIENDFGSSAKATWESAWEENKVYMNELQKVEHDYCEYKRLAEEATEEYQRKIVRLEKENIELTEQRNKEIEARANHEWEEINAKAKLEEAQLEIIELKAKLYDLMVKEG